MLIVKCLQTKMPKMSTSSDYILTFTCADRIGLVAAVSGALVTRNGFILDSQQYADLETGRFFMRVAFRMGGPPFSASPEEVRRLVADVAYNHGFDWSLISSAQRLRILICVSKASHCLNDLLHRWRTGALKVDIAGVISNHDAMRELTEWHGIGFHYLPVDAGSRGRQEAAIAEIMQETGSEVLVLARYMQVLSGEFVALLAGRCINIHHSFLPGFTGAKPYHRAHERGVKLIGATAHFVTADLDEGPIIEQSVERVDHRSTVDDMIRLGRDIEAQVLARAVSFVAERRVLLNGSRTVVFK